MARRRKGRPVTGVILLDKPPGWSSNALLQKVRWLFQAQKAGHTGALDPMATGLLPLCLGEATKFTRFLLDADKAYLAKAMLGVRTDTLDAEGVVIEQRPVPALDTGHIEALLQSRFTGDIEQVPPMYSALKRDGKKLYELARQGVEVERPSRPVRIDRVTLTDFQPPELSLDVACSKGTYIRTLVDDIGTELGCGAHLTALRRTRHGRFTLSGAVTLERLIELHEQGGPEALDALLLPLEDLLDDLPSLALPEAEAERFEHGNPVACALADDAPVQVRRESTGAFMGIAAIDDGQLKPVRLVASDS